MLMQLHYGRAPSLFAILTPPSPSFILLRGSMKERLVHYTVLGTAIIAAAQGMFTSSHIYKTAQEVGELRLAGSSNPQAGRLEIFLRGEWGTVCVEPLSLSFLPEVACRQLGFFTFSSAGTASSHGFSSIIQ